MRPELILPECPVCWALASRCDVDPGVIAAFLEKGAVSRVDSTSPSEQSDDCPAKTVYRARPREAARPAKPPDPRSHPTPRSRQGRHTCFRIPRAVWSVASIVAPTTAATLSLECLIVPVKSSAVDNLSANSGTLWRFGPNAPSRQGCVRMPTLGYGGTARRTCNKKDVQRRDGPGYSPPVPSQPSAGPGFLLGWRGRRGSTCTILVMWACPVRGEGPRGLSQFGCMQSNGQPRRAKR